MSEPKYPDVSVQLSGEDGNIGSIMGRVVDGLKRAGVSRDEIAAFRLSIFDASSYEDALHRVCQWVEVA